MIESLFTNWWDVIMLVTFADHWLLKLNKIYFHNPHLPGAQSV